MKTDVLTSSTGLLEIQFALNVRTKQEPQSGNSMSSTERRLRNITWQQSAFLKFERWPPAPQNKVIHLCHDKANMHQSAPVMSRTESLITGLLEAAAAADWG